MGRSLRVVVLLAFVACSKNSSETGSSQTTTTATPPEQPGVTLRIAYSSEKKAWMDDAVPAFLATHPKLASGKPIKIEAKSYGSGEAAQAILDGTFKAHVYSPASTAYLTLINQQWKQPKPIAPSGDPLVLSPVVIAMWKPMAQALGWPTKDIGWKDLIRVSKDPKGWGSLGHAEWGTFKLGHTAPDSSNSGLLAVLAEAYAATGKTRGLTRDDLAAAKTRTYVGEIENAIVHYGSSTGLFTEKMLERGPSYMSACVTYENMVIQSYSGTSAAPFPLVAVYPSEGTFWSDHPYATLDADWVGADEKAAAAQFLAFLKSKPMQERALALGFRPADPSIATAAPIDDAHGVDVKQPQTLLEVPPGDVLSALLETWQQEKKTADVMIVFDKSGSMTGEPLREAKIGAKAFLNGLGDRDSAAVMFFDNNVPDPPVPQALAKARQELLIQVDGVFADGGTSLYDAVASAYDLMLARARKEPGRIHAIVVMTDGQDESSHTKLDELEHRFSPENAPVKIFTIAYGDQAATGPLEELAKSAQGTSAKGNPETIVKIYQDMSAFF
jgi:Ca-activated chloride channel family protein